MKAIKVARDREGGSEDRALGNVHDSRAGEGGGVRGSEKECCRRMMKDQMYTI